MSTTSGDIAGTVRPFGGVQRRTWPVGSPATGLVRVPHKKCKKRKCPHVSVAELVQSSAFGRDLIVEKRGGSGERTYQKKDEPKTWVRHPPEKGKEGKWRHAAGHNVFFPKDNTHPVGLPDAARGKGFKLHRQDPEKLKKAFAGLRARIKSGKGFRAGKVPPGAEKALDGMEQALKDKDTKAFRKHQERFGEFVKDTAYPGEKKSTPDKAREADKEAKGEKGKPKGKPKGKGKGKGKGEPKDKGGKKADGDKGKDAKKPGKRSPKKGDEPKDADAKAPEKKGDDKKPDAGKKDGEPAAKKELSKQDAKDKKRLRSGIKSTLARIKELEKIGGKVPKGAKETMLKLQAALDSGDEDAYAEAEKALGKIVGKTAAGKKLEKGSVVAKSAKKKAGAKSAKKEPEKKVPEGKATGEGEKGKGKKSDDEKKDAKRKKEDDPDEVARKAAKLPPKRRGKKVGKKSGKKPVQQWTQRAVGKRDDKKAAKVAKKRSSRKSPKRRKVIRKKAKGKRESFDDLSSELEAFIAG